MRRGVVAESLVVGAVALAVLSGCSDDGDSTDSSETTIAPEAGGTIEEPFSPGADLTRWVTADEMAAVLDQVSIDFTGSPLADEIVTSREPDEIGDHGDSFWYRSGVPAEDVGQAFNGGWEVGLQLWDDELVTDDAPTDQGLPEGVRYFGPSFGGVTWFRGPMSEGSLMVWVNPPDRKFVGDTASEDDQANWQDVYNRVASLALREMAWAE